MMKRGTIKSNLKAKLNLAFAFVLAVFLHSCFVQDSEFSVNIHAKNKKVPMNVVLPLIYEGEIPIQANELQNSEKYSLLGGCTVVQSSDSDQNQSEDSESSDDTQSDEQESKFNVSSEQTGTSIPLFIIPTKDYEEIDDNKVRQTVYLIPEALAPGEHYCLTVNPMYKEKDDLSALTQTYTYEFDTVGLKANPEGAYDGPKYNDPDFFELGFPINYAGDQKNEFLIPINFAASKNFGPIFKFAKQSIPDESFLADPEKIRDSIEVCEILKKSEVTESEDNKENTNTRSKKNCSKVSGIQVKMIEDLPQSSDEKYTLSNYAYFTIGGGALKVNTPYLIKVLYSFGESEEDISQSDQVYSFMMLSDAEIALTLKPNEHEEVEEERKPTEENEEEIETGSEADNAELSEEEKKPEKTTLSVSSKEVFDAFKEKYGQAPGESYVEIPIRSRKKSSSKSK